MSDRFFTSRQRIALFLAADGCCEKCGTELLTGWHADHVIPHSAGGLTDVVNGQALCPACNLKKGATVSNPYDWQREATDTFYAMPAAKKDFLVCATPGAGKTRYALQLGARLLREGRVQRVAVVVPSDSLRAQWSDVASGQGLDLMPVSDAVDYDKSGYHGFVVSYQQLLKNGAALMRRALRRPTLVIFDEIHHAGKKQAWGDALDQAAEHAVHRVALTGTPWRRDTKSRIPFVQYNKSGKIDVDYAYEYGTAVADGVCRRIEFHSYDGEGRWVDPARSSVELTAKLGPDMDPSDVSAVLDALYEPHLDWMPDMIRRADAMLNELRVDVSDAAGLVVCERRYHARGCADLIEKLTGERPPVVISDEDNDPDGKIAKAQIDAFRDGQKKWIVAVKMISEGVDIQRLAIGVYASKVQTPLFFRQVVGRFVRRRKDEDFNARLLMPAAPELVKHAIAIEDELRHVLDLTAKEEQEAWEASGSRQPNQGAFNFRESVAASDAVFDRAIMSGDEITPEEFAEAQAECERCGIPIRYAAAMVSSLRRRKAEADRDQPAQDATAGQGIPEKVRIPRHKRETMLRGEIKNLANRAAHRRGWEPREINAELLRCGHPARGVATVEQLEAIRQTLVRWMAGQW